MRKQSDHAAKNYVRENKLVGCTGIEMRIQKHNATLSPRLNWKLQRINNVRLFGSISFVRLPACFFPFFFFLF